MKYAVFLRGINVSGQKIIKMNDLVKIFKAAKFKNVKTYIQSGNVALDSYENEDTIKKKSEKMLKKKLGYDVDVFVRAVDELKEIVRMNPFKKIRLGKNENPYVVLLQRNLKAKAPMKSKNNDVEVFYVKNDAAFSISRKIKGKGGFPNSFVEKELKTRATTRNWNTIEAMSNM
jgi:uncharacterized protein (DUF1697 family)